MSIMYCESTQPKTPLLLARYEAGKGASNTWFLIRAYIYWSFDQGDTKTQVGQPSYVVPNYAEHHVSDHPAQKKQKHDNPLSPLSLGFCKNDKSVTNPYNNIYGIIMLLFFP